MRFSLFDKFGALNSPPVFAAFARGLDRHGIARCHHDFDADVAVIWSMVWAGRMRANHGVWQHYRAHRRPVIVLEVGMIDRGHTWKIGINGTGLGSRFVKNFEPNRHKQLKVGLRPWRPPGANIVICMQRDDSEQWQGLPPARAWLDQTLDQLRSASDRPIQIRPHPRQPAYHPHGTELIRPRRLAGTYDGYDFDQILDQAWCVVNWNSGPACQAVIQGVPVFTGPDSLAAPVGLQDWRQIEAPVRPDRTAWLSDVCHTEWTVAEIESGAMLGQLLASIETL